MRNITNYILESANLKFKNHSLDDIARAVCSVFQTWEDDSDNWDPPFDMQDTVKDCTSIAEVFEYYDCWDDLYNELDIDDNDKDKFQDFCYDNDDEILDLVKKLC